MNHVNLLEARSEYSKSSNFEDQINFEVKL
jgi:hypothetical protein